jgi:sigma-E factor negative regulatory protein RseB
VIPPARSHWKVASTFVALGLLGSCATAVALAGAPSPAAGRRQPTAPGQAQRALRVIQPDTAAARLGRRLLGEAAAACRQVSYRGRQQVIWRGRGHSTEALMEVWHRSGSPTLTSAPDPQAASPAAGAQPTMDRALDQGGVLWVSPRLTALMLANYRVFSAGHGWVAGRKALVVELRRRDGSLAAQFWLDAATKLPLRRDTFDSHSRLLSTAAFTSLNLGSHGLRQMPEATGQVWTEQLGSAGLASMRASGWPLPQRLGDGLMLFAAARRFSSATGEVVHLSYSDGLSVVSLFVQRGRLAAGLPGWHRVTTAGRAVFASDPGERSLAWSADGFVYTVIADAPPVTVRQVVATLPYGNHPGFWARMARGFKRLVSWANPFR